MIERCSRYGDSIICFGCRSNSFRSEISSSPMRGSKPSSSSNSTRTTPKLSGGRDIYYWKQRPDKYATSFSAKCTCHQIRTPRPLVNCSLDVWFKHGTPNFTFLLWLVIKNRLFTAFQMANWGPCISSTCVLCSSHQKTREYLFFECQFSGEIWMTIAQGILGGGFTSE